MFSLIYRFSSKKKSVFLQNIIDEKPIIIDNYLHFRFLLIELSPTATQWSFTNFS